MELISNGPDRVALGRRAAETLRSQAGATEKTFAALLKLIAPVGTAAGMGAPKS
jgi:hypothetical protein